MNAWAVAVLALAASPSSEPLLDATTVVKDLVVDLRYATADYWTSYRLTFLFREEIIVVPTNRAEDRHTPYRRAFESERVFAYVHDPGRSREDVAAAERELRAANDHVEKRTAGGLTVFFVTRPAAP